MGLFSSKPDPYGDDALVRAARKRILAELQAKQSATGGNVVNNNLYGGGMGQSPGLMERMNGAEAEDPSLYDYLVDIERRDLPEINEATGKPAGWTKKVHRHREEKKK